MSITLLLEYVGKTMAIVLPACMSLGVLRILYLHDREKIQTVKWKKELTIYLFILYIASLYQITALRFGLSFSMHKIGGHNISVNYIPVTAPLRWLRYGYWWLFVCNVVGNMIWFIPLGVLVPMLFERCRRLYCMIMVGVIVSCSIETFQWLLATGVTDIDDVILNITGTVVGYLFWRRYLAKKE